MANWTGHEVMPDRTIKTYKRARKIRRFVLRFGKVGKKAEAYMYRRFR